MRLHGSLALALLVTLPAAAQWIDCLPEGQNLPVIPEIVAKDGTLRGTLLLTDEQQRMTFRAVPGNPPNDTNRTVCAPQYVRVFRGIDAYPAPPAQKGDYPDPLPGPTFRARVGDIIQITFLNQINPANFGNSIDRGELATGSGCDETSVYPANIGDTYPNCFHGSSTANIHFHGTHTNPNSTGDNVFLEIRPSLRDQGKPIVTADSVKRSFDEFFAKCEAGLRPNPLKQWPMVWADLPREYRDSQESLLKQYDKNPAIGRKLWPVNENQIASGIWPQYYIGAFPYCFRLPEYTAKGWPPPAAEDAHATHTQGAGSAEVNVAADPRRPLLMGQAPGTHWYHAHKHGSTAINVANGMTGTFIIEGKYDDELNRFYRDDNWTRRQPLIVINQLGVSPNLERGGAARTDKGPDFSVNGRLRPVVAMRSGEVQMWRLVNSSGRAGAFFAGPPDGVEWMQLAQDGVQFKDVNYLGSRNQPFLLAAGNRADLLVRVKPDTKVGKIPLKVQMEVDPSDLAKANPVTLFTINVAGKGVQNDFIPHAPSFPDFLADIADDEVQGTKKIVFASTGPGKGANHTIDGKKFSGEVGVSVLLNRVEEWKIVNKTYKPAIAHPFHIHINPFQVVEVFAPNDTMTAADGKTTIPRYIFQETARVDPKQCFIDLAADPESWAPCGSKPSSKDEIWWDVFPIPSGIQVTDANGKTVDVPGYFKLRSRFVDYSGHYVIHCHILAHEDRGMMTVVEVSPLQSPYSHH
jgi:FtsP/CotA-like multicopper oxidase with cupredoxin domain